MTGVRQSREYRCPQCNSSAVVDFGMAMVTPVGDRREFVCHCGHAFTIESSRHILGVRWEAVAEESAAAHL